MKISRALIASGALAGAALLWAETPPQKSAPPEAPPAGAPAPPAPTVTTAPFGTKIPSSVSANKQFTVYGGDLELRGAFCMLCEETSTALGRVLKDGAQHVLNVKVVLKTPPDITGVGDAVTLNIGELTHGGFHLQINAELRTGFRTPDFTRQLVRVLLAERILRNHKQLSTTRQKDVLPEWVMTGVAQAMEYRSRSRPSALFSAVFRKGQIYSLDRILAADPKQLDALSRGIYETSTCALVLMLLDQPDGPVRFARFLNALAVESKSDRDLLKQHFPNLATSGSAMEKWWSLQMAALGTPSALETLGIKDTESELDDALTLVIPGARTSAKSSAQAEAPAEARDFHGWDALPASAAETALAWLRVPSVADMLGGGRQVIFGFKKKPKGEEEPEASDKPKDDKAKEEKPKAAPAKDSKKPAPATGSKSGATESAPALPPKPGDARSVGSRPDDLPKAPAPAAEQSDKPAAETKGKPADEPKAGEEERPERKGTLNPFNWFRKKPDSEEKAAEESPPPAAPAPPSTQSATKAPPRKAANEPATKSATGPKPGNIPLEDFALIAKHPDRTEILTRCLAKLNALKVRAHPLYRPLLGEYVNLVGDIRQDKTKGAAAQLEALRREREAVHDRAIAVETHLDWYEANHTGTLSRAFEDFLHLDEELERERIPRSDDLSKYLDAVQAEYK